MARSAEHPNRPVRPVTCTGCGQLVARSSVTCLRCGTANPAARDEELIEAAVRAHRPMSVWRILAIFLAVAAVAMIIQTARVVRDRPADPPSRETATAELQARHERIARLIAAHELEVGMSSDEAQASWGKPDHVNASTSAGGTHLQWVYGDDHPRYIYLVNGVVTSYSSTE